MGRTEERVLGGVDRARAVVCLTAGPGVTRPAPSGSGTSTGAARRVPSTARELAQEVLSGPERRTVLSITHAAFGLDLADRVVDLGSKETG
jgi:hypothetical protein